MSAGLCEHGQPPQWCLLCLQDEVARLRASNAELLAALESIRHDCNADDMAQDRVERIRDTATAAIEKGQS